MSSTSRFSSIFFCSFSSHRLSPSLSRLSARTVLTDGGRRTSRAIRFAQCVEMPSPCVPADTLAHGCARSALSLCDNTKRSRCSCCLPEVDVLESDVGGGTSIDEDVAALGGFSSRRIEYLVTWAMEQSHRGLAKPHLAWGRVEIQMRRARED